MAYDGSDVPPPPPPPPFPAPESQPPEPQQAYYATDTAFTDQRRRSENTCWKIGCIIAAILGLVSALCIGGCYLMASRVMRGPLAASAMWFGMAQTGQADALASATSGGSEKARELLDAIEARVGRIAQAQPLVASGAELDWQGQGTDASFDFMLMGDKGTANCTVKMVKSGKQWLVADIEWKDTGAGPPPAAAPLAPGETPASQPAGQDDGSRMAPQ